jgi:chemotaxis protein MotB
VLKWCGGTDSIRKGLDGRFCREKKEWKMVASKRPILPVVRKCAFLGLFLIAVLIAGCCPGKKQLEEQVMQLDSQIADLQGQVAKKEATIAECNQIADELRRKLKEVEADRDVCLEKLEEVVIVRIPDKIMVHSGTAMVLDSMVPTLKAIASSIGQHPTWDVYVEGYTDNKKIKEEWLEKWPSNWELGAYRAAAVTRYLTNDLSLEAERFAVVSYGPFRPLADNSTPEGREMNRVVQIVLHKPENR